MLTKAGSAPILRYIISVDKEHDSKSRQVASRRVPLPLHLYMTARGELMKDIEVTDRLLQYGGYSEGLRRRLLEAKAAMLSELAALDGQSTKKPTSSCEANQFSRVPRKIG